MIQVALTWRENGFSDISHRDTAQFAVEGLHGGGAAQEEKGGVVGPGERERGGDNWRCRRSRPASRPSHCWPPAQRSAGVLPRVAWCGLSFFLGGLSGGSGIFAPFVVNVGCNQPDYSANDKEENSAEEIDVNPATQKQGDDSETGKHQQTTKATFPESGIAHGGPRRGRARNSNILWWLGGPRFTPLRATTPARIKLILELRITS